MDLSCYICFFFQAEDGIRDIGVTGVQTCALPIFRVTTALLACMALALAATPWLLNRLFTARELLGGAPGRDVERSEERRVGKECKSGASPDQSKKKTERRSAQISRAQWS